MQWYCKYSDNANLVIAKRISKEDFQNLRPDFEGVTKDYLIDRTEEALNNNERLVQPWYSMNPNYKELST